MRNLTKRFGTMVAVDSADLEIKAGSFYGFVGPNGAGKTTTLSMVTGLLRPDSGVVKVYGADVWRNASVAKRMLGVLPDRLRLFDRLTGAEYLHHSAGLRGLDRETTLNRTADLVNAFGLEHSLHRFVSDYSAGMVKKISIASAMIHSPRLLVLDEPFESVDPVSAQLVIDILKKFTAAGGTVLMSSHSMHLIERICDHVAIIADGRMLASGTLDEVLRRALARGPVRRTGRRRDSGGGHGVVAQLLRLKLRLFANGFRRPLWAVIVSGIGLAIAIAVVLVVTTGAAALHDQDDAIGAPDRHHRRLVPEPRRVPAAVHAGAARAARSARAARLPDPVAAPSRSRSWCSRSSARCC